jgi:tetratricopeptide (TPR) repeat protein
MKKNQSLFLIVFLLLILPLGKIIPQSIDQLIEDGDKYYKQFDNEKALDVFKKAEKNDGNNFEVLWRISRTYVELAEKMPSSTSDQEKAQVEVYQKGLDYSERAVKKDPNNSIGYLRRAIANGRIALFKGIFSVGGVVNQVKEDCEKAIQLNNGGNFTQGVAHYVLGRTLAKVSEKPKIFRWPLGLTWADNEVALEEYKKAIALYPGYIMFYVDYAISLEREDDYKTAKEMLNKAFSCQKQHQEDDTRLAEGKKLWEEIKNK